MSAPGKDVDRIPCGADGKQVAIEFGVPRLAGLLVVAIEVVQQRRADLAMLDNERCQLGHAVKACIFPDARPTESLVVVDGPRFLRRVHLSAVKDAAVVGCKAGHIDAGCGGFGDGFSHCSLHGVWV